MIRTTALTLVITLLTAGTTHAQHADALAGSAHQGLWDLGSQPAAISYGAARMEVNLVHTMADVDNSFLHLRRDGFGLLRHDRVVSVDEGRLALEGVNGERRSLNMQARLLGPSFMMRVDKANSFAVHTAVRTAGHTTDLDGLMRLLNGGTAPASGTPAGDRNALQLRSSQLAWAEAGVTYARRVQLDGPFALHLAATGRYLMALGAAHVRMNAPVVATTDSGTTVSQVDAEYVFSDLDLVAGRLGGFRSQGHGFGADAGIVLEWLRPEARYTCGMKRERGAYFLRAGIAVTDLGHLTLKRGSQARVRSGSADLEAIQNVQVNDPAQAGAALEELFGEGVVEHGDARGRRLALPTTLRFHVDVCPVKHLAIRMAGSLGLERATDSPRSPSELVVAVRYESRWVDVGMPVTFHQFHGVRVGLGLRAGPFTIGSDKLGGLLGLTDLYGADVYVGLKLNLGRRWTGSPIPQRVRPS